MKFGSRTRAIGRHLVDLPKDATTIESYWYNGLKIALLPESSTRDDVDRLIAQKEEALRATKHDTNGSMFVDRIVYANGSVTLISWKRPYNQLMYVFETYFRAGSRTVEYTGEVGPSRRQAISALCERLSQEWSEIPAGDIPQGIGFAADQCLLGSNLPKRERWSMQIQLQGRPDVSLRITSYTQGRVEPGLRERAGGVLPALIGAFVGVGQLRNRARPVGPIEADEILIAGTQDGKRTYGFKWEAPGKASSLAEPNLNVSLQVGESAYLTNKESFSSDGEALEIWDAVVGSIRLRPGAV